MINILQQHLEQNPSEFVMSTEFIDGYICFHLLHKISDSEKNKIVDLFKNHNSSFLDEDKFYDGLKKLVNEFINKNVNGRD